MALGFVEVDLWHLNLMAQIEIMPHSRPDLDRGDVTPERERESISEPYLEVVSLFNALKQNFPDVYRHVLGIAKAFLKER